jgi:hypothetical protein
MRFRPALAPVFFRLRRTRMAAYSRRQYDDKKNEWGVAPHAK